MSRKAKLNILIRHALASGLDRETFQRCSGLTPSTFNRRMANTDDITVGELRGMLKAIKKENIKPEAILDFIWEGK